MIHWLFAKQKRRFPHEAPKILEELHRKEIAQYSAEDCFLRAVCLDTLGQARSARDWCRRALQKNFLHLPSMYSLGLKCFEFKDFKQAKRWLQRAIDLDSEAADNVLYLRKRFKTYLSPTEADSWAHWCLEVLEHARKSSLGCRFELARLHFEFNRFEKAENLFEKLMRHKPYREEAAQYLSYIYERHYRGADLIQKNLELASRVSDRADLFFNLAMLCQHEQGRLDLALHFFYLASLEEPQDPGLRFSLEQACIEYIGQGGDDIFHLMIAHLYHGSLAVAERYAKTLQGRFHWRFPDSFLYLEPRGLWRDWLLAQSGILIDALSHWFADSPQWTWRFHRSSHTETSVPEKRESR